MSDPKSRTGYAICLTVLVDGGILEWRCMDGAVYACGSGNSPICGKMTPYDNLVQIIVEPIRYRELVSHQRLQGWPLKDDEFPGLIGQNVFVVIERCEAKRQKLVAIDQGLLVSR